jgi:hypothetical protein
LARQGVLRRNVALPQTALVRHLKNRSPFISITLEDIIRITGTLATIYTIGEDPAAVRPPSTEPSSPDRKGAFSGLSSGYFQTSIM